MQIDVNLAGHAFIALLDSGSTHNFISESTAQRTGLPLQHRPCLTATVVNDDRVSCVGIIRQAAITIHGDIFLVDLFVMPLAGYDMVLGHPVADDAGPDPLRFWRTKPDLQVAWQVRLLAGGAGCCGIPRPHSHGHANPTRRVARFFRQHLRGTSRPAAAPLSGPWHHAGSGCAAGRGMSLPLPGKTQGRARTPVLRDAGTRAHSAESISVLLSCSPRQEA
jgi:hypothetical protein